MCACVLCCAVLLLLMGSVLCVERCGGVRRARAVRVCVSESRVDLCVQRARRRVLCAVLCCAPCLCSCKAQPWLGEGCAVGCGALRVVVRLPDGVRRPRSPPDRVVGGPGSEHANARCM